MPWLLEESSHDPGVRYLALTQLLGRKPDEPEVIEARQQVMRTSPVPVILAAQSPEGYWARPGGGYAPSYKVTLWQVIFLAELGADGRDERVRRGCEYLLNNNLAANGAFSESRKPVPSAVIHCLNGEPLYALLRLGSDVEEPRIQAAIKWEAEAITGEGQIKYFKSGTCGPSFTCAQNQKQPCAWGAAKALKALALVPSGQQSPTMARAVEVGAEFLLSHELAEADYPFTERINSTWFKFGFPLSYRSDILETASVLVDLGYGGDPRLVNALEFILSKQDEEGRWKMDKSLNGKMWVDIEQRGALSKWITLRALRVFKEVDDI